MPETHCLACGQPIEEGARFCGSCGESLPETSEDVERLVGQTVGGRYLITRVIAEGGMGVVYAAEQKMGSGERQEDR